MSIHSLHCPLCLHWVHMDSFTLQSKLVLDTKRTEDLNVEQRSHMRDCCPLHSAQDHVTAQVVTDLSRQRPGLDKSPVGFTMGKVSLRELSSNAPVSHVCTAVPTYASQPTT